jgi:uncharacterized membrane protein YecN with MAPEG domain
VVCNLGLQVPHERQQQAVVYCEQGADRCMAAASWYKCTSYCYCTHCPAGPHVACFRCCSRPLLPLPGAAVWWVWGTPSGPHGCASCRHGGRRDPVHISVVVSALVRARGTGTGVTWQLLVLMPSPGHACTQCRLATLSQRPDLTTSSPATLLVLLTYNVDQGSTVAVPCCCCCCCCCILDTTRLLHDSLRCHALVGGW